MIGIGERQELRFDRLCLRSQAGLTIKVGEVDLARQPSGAADCVGPSSWALRDDLFEHFQIDISSTDDRDHLLAFEALFSFEQAPNAQRA